MSVTKVKVARPFISKSKVSSSLYSQLVALLVAVIRERAAQLTPRCRRCRRSQKWPYTLAAAKPESLACLRVSPQEPLA